MTSGGKWLRGGLIGCGVLVAIPVAAVLVVTVRTCTPLQSASRSFRQLEERFGAPAAFVPPPGESVDAGRMEVFLQVRRTLMPACRQLVGLDDAIERVHGINDEPADGEELVGASLDVMDIASKLTPFVGEFFKQRNRILLELEMGLGEYSYLYAASYRDRLLDSSIRDQILSSDAAVSEQAGATLRAILGRSWKEPLPEPLAAAIAPYREALDATFCPPSAGIEMDHDSGRALKLALY